MYKVFRVDGGYQIFFVNGDEKRPVDGEKVYPSRQNAYNRAQVLNQQSTATTTIDVRLTVQRANCLKVERILREERDIQHVRIEDPLRQGEFEYERRITFNCQCRDNDNDTPRRAWQKQPATVHEFTGWLQSLPKNHKEIEHVHALIGGMPYEW